MCPARGGANPVRALMPVGIVVRNHDSHFHALALLEGVITTEHPPLPSRRCSRISSTPADTRPAAPPCRAWLRHLLEAHSRRPAQAHPLSREPVVGRHR